MRHFVAKGTHIKRDLQFVVMGYTTKGRSVKVYTKKLFKIMKKNQWIDIKKFNIAIGKIMEIGKIL